MKIAIIGAGNVGGALGRDFLKTGHAVAFGVRDIKSPSLDALRKETKATIGLTRDVTKNADIAMIATPWSATKGAVTSAGPLDGKIVVDCTNPIRADFSDLDSGRSAAEQIQEWLPGARVVKCFNQTGFQNMSNPCDGPQRPLMLAAGDDENARSLVAKLATEIGFDGIALGP